MEREKASVDTADRGRRPLRSREGACQRRKPEALSTESRRSLADRPVLVVKLLLVWGGGGAKGPADQECRFVQPGRRVLGGGEATCQSPKRSRLRFPSRWSGRRGGGSRPTRARREWTVRISTQFEADLEDNLYKIWNRMSSGTWFPPPVRAVEIPKPHGGGVRVLGVPTIADRVAQTVVAMHLEERADHRFHPDSYGYRPGTLGSSGARGMPAAVLEVRLGDRSRRPEVLRRGAVGPRWSKRCRAVTDAAGCCCMSSGGLRPRCSIRTAPLSSAARELRKGRRSRRSWRTCSCTTRSIPGWSGSSRAARLSATPTMRSCTARRVRQAEQVLARIAARMSEVGLTASPGQNADRLLQGRSAPGRARAHLVHLPRVRLPGTGGAQQERPDLHRVPACDQPRGAEGQKRSSSAGCGSIGAPTCRWTTWRDG